VVVLPHPDGAEQREEFAPADGEMRVMDGHVPAEPFHHPVELNDGVAGDAIACECGRRH
jgi:hypothetical protein